MDISFQCPKCNQELAAEENMAGSEIDCPACNHRIVIPRPATPPPPEPAYQTQGPETASAMSSSAGAKEEKHFVVPVHEKPVAALIEKPKPPLEFAKDGDKKLRIRCIKRTECVEVGKDHFDEVVTEFLSKVGEANVVSINTINYSAIDMGTRQILTDYGLLIVYRG